MIQGLCSLILFGFLLVFGGTQAAQAAVGDTLLHNSVNTGSTRWGGNWGTSTGKYGQFTCTTCHEPGASNIKRIKGTISTPDGTNWTSTGTQNATVVFKTVTGMGRDDDGHATSVRICEVCHTQVKHHNYNSSLNIPNGGDLTHPNTDCTACHPHSAGFKNTGGCDGCHGNPPITSNHDATAPMTGLVSKPEATGTGAMAAGVAGVHQSHNAIYTNNCNACHTASGTVMPSVSHTIQMGFNYFGGYRSGTFTGYTSLINTYNFVAGIPGTGTTVLRRNNQNNNCSSVYCHGGGDTVSGKPALAGGTSFKNPNWIDTSGSPKACGACHGTTFTTYTSTGSHDRHLNPTQMTQLTCDKCHGTTSDNSHVNGSVSWRLYTTWDPIGGSATYDPDGAVGPAYSGSTGTVAPSSIFGTCNNLYCHSNGTGTYQAPTWGNTLAANCLGCHGGSATPATLNTLSHQAHMNNAAYLGTNFGCVECHAKTVSSDTAVSNSANHVNAFKDFSGAKAYRTGYSNGNCTTYCHSGGKAGAPAATSVNWSTGPAINDCKACHGVGSSIAGEPIYANGAAPLVNNHNKHVASAADCVNCHFRTTANGTSIVAGSTLHLDKAMNVNFKLLPFANNSGAYNTPSARNCTNTYCHGAATPTWGGLPLVCNSCHSVNNSGYWATNSAHRIHEASATLFPANFSNISGNVSSATEYRFSCSACHDPGVTKSVHANGAKTSVRAADVFFGFTTAGVRPTYAQGALAGAEGSLNWTSGTANNCAATYCHGNGQTPRTDGVLVNWATTAPTSSRCSKCHGFGATLSGRHDKHVENVNYLGSNIKCADCHEKTLTQGTYSSINNKKMHINKFRDYSGSKAWRTGYVAGTKTCNTTWCHSNGKIGTFQAYTASVTWTAGVVPRFRCNQCHGNVSSTYGEPGYANGGGATANNHTIHVVTKQITCDKCHRNTAKLNSYTTLLSTNTAHLNRSIQDVAFNSYSVNGRGYTLASKTCTNIYCHSNGKGSYSNPLWGGGVLDCAGCHKIDTLSTGHRFHIYTSAVPTLWNYTANKSTNIRYNYGCAVCHPVASTGHNNGTVELYFASNETGTGSSKQKNTAITGGSPGPVGTAAGAYGTPGTSVKCFNIYCHSNGYAASFKYYTSPEWYTSAGAPTDKCAMCHGNSPNTNRGGDNKLMAGSPTHSAHVVGIHYDNVYNGVSGKTPSSGNVGVSAGHGDPAQSLTINCNVCHGLTVTYTRNDQNTACVTCHSAQTNKALISNKSRHVNGSVDISFSGAVIKSKAQLRTASFEKYTLAVWSPTGRNYKTGANAYDTGKNALNNTYWNGGTKNCSNIACHNGVAVNWVNDTGKAAECVICHSKL